MKNINENKIVSYVLKQWEKAGWFRIHFSTLYFVYIRVNRVQNCAHSLAKYDYRETIAIYSKFALRICSHFHIECTQCVWYALCCAVLLISKSVAGNAVFK